MHRNELHVQIDKRTENGQEVWVLTHTPEWARRNLDDVTLALLIKHDWSEDEDQYEFQVWDFGDRQRVLPDFPIAECTTFDEEYECWEMHEDDPENNPFPYAPMSTPKEKLFRQMVERWKALNMLATFQVTW